MVNVRLLVPLKVLLSLLFANSKTLIHGPMLNTVIHNSMQNRNVLHSRNSFACVVTILYQLHYIWSKIYIWLDILECAKCPFHRLSLSYFQVIFSLCHVTGPDDSHISLGSLSGELSCEEVFSGFVQHRVSLIKHWL